MKESNNIDINKVILIMLVVLMIIPFSIDILGFSLTKISTVIISITFLGLLVKRKSEIKEILKNKFVIFNILLSIVILLSLIANYRTILFNDLYEVIKYVIFTMITIIIMLICKNQDNYIFILNSDYSLARLNNRI